METMTEDQVQLESALPALKACPLFQSLKDEHFQQIVKIAEPVRFAPGEVIVEEGTDADAFFIILEGEAAIQLSSPAGDAVELGRIPKGSTFGEMALLLEKKRGQLLVEIDGRPASTYSLDEARRALRSDGSHPITVTDASGKKAKLTLELPSM